MPNPVPTPTPPLRRAAGLLLATLGLATAGLSQASAADTLPLADWARQNDLRLSRNPTSREITASSPQHRFLFQVDSSRIEFDGIAIWLSNPVTLVDNQPHIALQDSRGVLRPLLAPPKLPPGRRIRTICIDPGHGGKDPGHKAGTRLEKTFTLALARELRNRLADAGFRTILTRTDDAYVDHPDRTTLATRAKADLFVSLHFNASPDGSPDASGLEVYAMTPEGAKSTNISRDVGSLRAGAGNEFDPENLLLATSVQRSLLTKLPGSVDRGVRRARFLVLRLSEMPAILIEGGFMTNPSDARWIYSDTGRRRLAQAITDGIQSYRRLVERPAGSGTGSGPTPQRGTSSTSSTSSTRPDSARN